MDAKRRPGVALQYGSPRTSEVRAPHDRGLIYLVALIFWVAYWNAQQSFGIQEPEKAGRQCVGGIVNISWPDSAVRPDKTQIRVRPLRPGPIQCVGEGLNVGTSQPRGGYGVRRFRRMRGHAQVMMVSRAQGFSHFGERFRFHRLPFNARVRRRHESAPGMHYPTDSGAREEKPRKPVTGMLR